MTDQNASAAAGSANGQDASHQGAGGTTTTTTNGQQPSWRDGLPADLRANPALSSFADVGALAKEHVNLQGLIGRKGIIPPTETDPPEAWQKFYKDLGRPDKPEEYGFKPPDGAPQDIYDPNFAGKFAKWAYEAGIPKAQAQKLHDSYVKEAIDGHKQQMASLQATGKAMEEALRAEWGAAYDGKVESGRRAFKAFTSPDMADRMEKVLGSTEMMKMFASIGEKMGEDNMIGANSGSRATMTPQEAQGEIAKINGQMRDPKSPLMDKFHPEHGALMGRLEQLHQMAYPDLTDNRRSA